MGGDGVRATFGGDADGPLLTVWLGPVEPPPPDPPDDPEPEPLPLLAPPVGEGAVPAGSWPESPGDAVVGGGTAEEVAGAVLTLVVAVGASVPEPLPHPVSRAADAMAADAATSAAARAWWMTNMSW